MSHSIKTFTLFRVALAISVLFLSCSKHSDPANQIASFQAGPGIYVSGFVFGSPDVATLWKNSTRLSLNADRALSITSKGNDTYTAGIISNTKAVYWKNDAMTVLQLPTDGMGLISVSGIAIAGSDVYVVGYYVNLYAKAIAVYWKNGILVTPKNFSVNAITASGNDIYMVGILDGKYAYTKNDIPVYVDNFYPEGIAISGNDVVLYGSIPDKFGSVATLGYWKNGVITNMGTNIELDALYVKDGNVYLAGFDNNKVGNYIYGGTYWKNGIATRLNPNMVQGLDGEIIAVNGIYVDNSNNVYVAGQSSRKVIGGVAAYWKNGTRVELTTQGSWAMGIAVIE